MRGPISLGYALQGFGRRDMQPAPTRTGRDNDDRFV
jgi:hypothetical protein